MPRVATGATLEGRYPLDMFSEVWLGRVGYVGVVGDSRSPCSDGGELLDAVERALEGGVNAGVPSWLERGLGAVILWEDGNWTLGGE